MDQELINWAFTALGASLFTGEVKAAWAAAQAPADETVDASN